MGESGSGCICMPICSFLASPLFPTQTARPPLLHCFAVDPMNPIGIQIVVILSCCCLPLHASPRPSITSPPSSSPVCAGSRTPVVLGGGLSFCGYNSGMISCCDTDADAALRERFMGMNVSDPDCATVAKAILCATCDPSPPLLGDPATSRPPLPLACAGAAAAASSSNPSRGIQEEDGMVCLERLATGSSYLGLVPHADGSGRAFLYTQDGEVWLAEIPARGSGTAAAAAMRVGDRPFLDLTDRVRHDAALGLGGLVGFALHPRFTSSGGRLFVSYIAERCSAAAAANGARPCKYRLVVAELSVSVARGGGGDHAKVARANAYEVRRIFTMRLPQTRKPYSNSNRQYGGQILIGPPDGYLYLVTGHGEEEATDKMPFLGKIIRFDINGQSRGSRSTSTAKPEIFAMGLSNPRGCSFDSGKPSDLYCTNVDQQQGEQVHLISISKSGRARVSLVVDHGLPAAGTAPSILGGFVYRGSANPWLNGRYVYMYGSAAWAAVETPTPASGGRYAAARIPSVRCSAGGTAMPCAGGSSSVLSLLGEDNSKDAFVFATGGVFRVAEPGLCSAPPPPSPPQPSKKQAGLAWQLFLGAFSLVFAFYLVWSMMFGGGAQCCGNIFCCIWNCGGANSNSN